jgi:kumamolisin
MTTEETSHPYDYLYVKIRDVYGNNLTTLQTLSDGSATGTWVSSSFDVSAYVGQSIQVYFWGTTDNSYKTSFFVDDVRLSACEGG